MDLDKNNGEKYSRAIKPMIVFKKTLSINFNKSLSYPKYKSVLGSTGPTNSDIYRPTNGKKHPHVRRSLNTVVIVSLSSQ